MNEKILELFSYLSKIEEAVQIRRKVLTDYYDYDPAKIFKKLDIDNKNYITCEDIILYLRHHNIPYTDESVKLLIVFYDSDFDGMLSFSEFVSLIQNNNVLLNKKKINVNLNPNDNKLSFNIEYCLTKLFEKEIELNQYIVNILRQINNNINNNILVIFKEISLNKKYISYKDIKNYLDNNHIEYTKTQIDNIMRRLDINKDGKIDFNEFDYLFGLTNLNNNILMSNINDQPYNSNILDNDNNNQYENIYENPYNLNEFNNINNINDNIEEKNINNNININNHYNDEFYLNNSYGTNPIQINNNNLIRHKELYRTPIIEKNYKYNNINSFSTPCCDCILKHKQINNNNFKIREEPNFINSFNNIEQNKYYKNNVKNIEPYDDFQINNNEMNNNYECNNEENLMINTNNYNNNNYNNTKYNFNYNKDFNNSINNSYNNNNYNNNDYINKDFFNNSYNYNNSIYNNNNNSYINNYSPINEKNNNNSYINNYNPINENNNNNSYINNYNPINENNNNKSYISDIHLFQKSKSPGKNGHISNSLSLRSSPLRRNPPHKKLYSVNTFHTNHSNYNKDISTYFYEQINDNIINQLNKDNVDINKNHNNNNNNNYDSINSNSYSNYNFDYQPPIKRNRSQGNFIINKKNIYNNNIHSNNLISKDKNILSEYFKLIMEGESQIELNKKNLITRKDFNIKKTFNLFDEENKGYIAFEDLKNELEFMGLSLDDKDIELLIKRFNRNTGNIIDYNNFYNGILPYSSENRNKYKEQNIDKKNVNDINIFSPSTRLYFKALINNMINVEKKLNDYKKENIDIKNKNINDILNEIDFDEQGYININEFIKYLKEKDAYSSLKDVELLFSRFGKKKEDGISYDDIISDLNYI